MGKKLLLIGGGGHCRSVADSVLAGGYYEEIGIVEKDSSFSSDLPIVGTDADLVNLFQAGWKDAFITVGSIGNTTLRRRLYELVKSVGLKIPTVVDPSAVVSRHAELQEGVFVGKRAVVNAGSVIDVCAIINSGAVIEHDCRVGAFSRISPGTVLCGQVQIEADSHIGAASVVKQLITVGCSSVIGAGSVVVKPVPDHVTAYGNPCKVINR